MVSSSSRASSSRKGGNDRANSRAAILSAARLLLEENGAAVTLDQVATRAGVSRQAIYLHFEGRNELMIAVADDAREKVGILGLVAAMDAASTPRAVIGAL